MNASSLRTETSLYVLHSIPRVWWNAWNKTGTLKILLMIEWTNTFTCIHHMPGIVSEAPYALSHLIIADDSRNDEVINQWVKEWVTNEWGGKWRKEFQGQPLVHYPQHPDISLHCLASSNHVLSQGPFTAIASQHIGGVTLQSRISIGMGKNSWGSFL